MAGHLEILAPLSGIMVPLEQVPDPVFAQKMVGDGISIDPTSSEMLAPVSGKIVNLHRACHALTIESETGVEVLIHIGIDTVELKGEGFTPLVKEGDVVKLGQPLIRFSLDSVGRKARSLLTQILITNGDLVKSYAPASGLVTAGKSVALKLELAVQSAANKQESSSDGSDIALGNTIVLPNPNYILKPQMFATVTVNNSDSKDAIAIPSTALIFDHSQYYVLIYKSRKDVELRPVEVISINGDTAFIKSGVSVGDYLIGSQAILIYGALSS